MNFQTIKSTIKINQINQINQVTHDSLSKVIITHKNIKYVCYSKTFLRNDKLRYHFFKLVINVHGLLCDTDFLYIHWDRLRDIISEGCMTSSKHWKGTKLTPKTRCEFIIHVTYIELSEYYEKMVHFGLFLMRLSPMTGQQKKMHLIHVMLCYVLVLSL